MASISTPTPPHKSGPAWEIAELFPDQGNLSDDDYLIATRHTRRLVEFTDGYIETLPMPTTEHQLIVQFLSNLLLFFVQRTQVGRVLFAPLRVRLRAGKFREPDIVFMRSENASRVGNEFWDGADLVMEVVSTDKPERDYISKRADYAEAGIPEYWIIDPANDTIEVLKLDGGEYVAHSGGAKTGSVRSALLPNFEVDVAAVFAAGRVAR